MASFKPNGGQLEGAGKSEGPKLNDLNKSPWENDRILIGNDIIPFCIARSLTKRPLCRARNKNLAPKFDLADEKIQEARGRGRRSVDGLCYPTGLQFQ